MDRDADDDKDVMLGRTVRSAKEGVEVCAVETHGRFFKEELGMVPACLPGWLRGSGRVEGRGEVGPL